MTRRDEARAADAYARGLWVSTTLAGALADAARETPDRVLVVDGDTALFELLTPGSEHEILAEAMRRGNVREFAVVRPTLSEIYREVAA